MKFLLFYGIEFTDSPKGQKVIGVALLITLVIGCCI